MRRALAFMVLLVVPAAGVRIASELHRYPDRFAEVVPHQVYRGAYPTRDQLAHLADDLGVRRVVNLTDHTNRTRERDEKSAAAERGIQVLQFPLPGNGIGPFEIIDAAADAVAGPQN